MDTVASEASIFAIRDWLDLNCFLCEPQGEPSLSNAPGQSEFDLYQSRLFVSEPQELLGSSELPPGSLKLPGLGFVHQHHLTSSYFRRRALHVSMTFLGVLPVFLANIDDDDCIWINAIHDPPILILAAWESQQWQTPQRISWRS